MQRPHERFGLPQPFGRRLPGGLFAWNSLIVVVTVGLVVGYVIQVNRASSRGFHLRDVEKKIERLTSEVLGLEDKVATLSSVQSITQQAEALGFVTVERLEFANPAAKEYAVAR